jgi:hypothetical protein
MPTPFNLLGLRFGRLVVIEKALSLNGRSRWLCLCDCGNKHLALGQNLRNGHVSSCGCLLSEVGKAKMLKYNKSLNREIHNETKTRLYHIYIGIKSRCYARTHHTYTAYGAHGIRMCDEWFDSFIAFRDWSLQNGYNDNLTIDRINPKDNYKPSNCRWVNHSIQNFNKSPSSQNTSGHIGVSFYKQTHKYKASISRNGIQYHLGYFETFDAACEAREQAEKEYYS